MKKCKCRITKEQYDRAQQHHGYIAKEDEEDIFTTAELLGYGVYGSHAVQEGDEYFVEYYIGDSCD